MQMHMIETPIERRMIEEIATANFLGLVKVVVDIERQVMAIGGQMYADEEAVLLDDGSDSSTLPVCKSRSVPSPSSPPTSPSTNWHRR